MIELAEARAHVLAGIGRLPAVSVRLADALGAVTAEPVTSAEDVPPFPNSAVDGYAVRAADTVSASAPAPVELAVAGTIAAGAPPSIPVVPGGAVRIMTGAPMPPGADAVVMVEDTEVLAGGGRVRIGRAATCGDGIRAAGGDVARGERVLDAGVVLRPAHLEVLASIGQDIVVVHRRPRVGVLATGDELVTGGGALGPGQIRESNRVMVVALVSEAGCTPVDLGVVGDDEAAITAALTGAVAGCDAVITTGGVSMGDFDLVKVVLDRLGAMEWMQIAIKPAKPFAFGLLGADGAVPVFGLPGNPAAALVSFEVLARPALRTMLGDPEIDRPTVTAVADDGLPRRPGDPRLHLVRVHGAFGADGRWHVGATGSGGGLARAAASANGIARVPPGPGVAPGGDVEVLLLR